MKRTVFLLTALLLIAAITSSACAVSALSDSMFNYAKGALTALAAGAFDKLVTKLPFSGVSPSAKEWQGFAQNSFSALIGSKPQTEYAVAYWTGSTWKIAVPVSTPESKGVETFVLVSEDGQTFTGYGSAPWGNVCSEYRSADYVTWNSEYNASTSAVVEFDD